MYQTPEMQSALRSQREFRQWLERALWLVIVCLSGAVLYQAGRLNAIDQFKTQAAIKAIVESTSAPK